MLGQMIAEIFLVFPWGVEPQSSEPESDILSIELWEHALQTEKHGISRFSHTVIAHSDCLECKVNVFFDFYHYL